MSLERAILTFEHSPRFMSLFYSHSEQLHLWLSCESLTHSGEALVTWVVTLMELLVGVTAYQCEQEICNLTGIFLVVFSDCKGRYLPIETAATPTAISGIWWQNRALSVEGASAKSSCTILFYVFYKIFSDAPDQSDCSFHKLHFFNSPSY